MYCIEIIDASGKVKNSASGEGSARLLHNRPYEQGDAVRFSAQEPYCFVQADQALPEALVYLPDKQFTYQVPKAGAALPYAPQAFSGEMHILQICPARPGELTARRNLAMNPLDQRFCEKCFPHATANIETRDDPTFFARNVIDGLKFNHSHGNWPFSSWGIGGRSDAEITLHFGRPVKVEEVGLTLRADFPHDSWWTHGTLSFSDGHQMTLSFQKTSETQYFTTGEHVVEWMRFHDLKKAFDLSPFPALTQWEVFGREV
jgi:hypothetical protein